MSKFLNVLICTISVFLLAFAWTVYCLKSPKWAALLALFISVCSAYLFYALQKRTDSQKNAKLRHKKLLNGLFSELQFGQDNAQLFCKMLEYYRFDTQPLDFDNIVATKNKRELVALCFQTEGLKTEQLQQSVVLAKRNSCQRLTVFCNKADNALVALANSRLETRIVDLANTYLLLEEAGCLPQISTEKVQKNHLLPQIAFNKKRFGWYFAGALYLMLLSFFSYFKIYLLVWATVMLFLALFSLFNTRYNKLPTCVTLD